MNLQKHFYATDLLVDKNLMDCSNIGHFAEFIIKILKPLQDAII